MQEHHIISEVEKIFYEKMYNVHDTITILPPFLGERGIDSTQEM